MHRKILNLPKHRNPDSKRPDRIACAPYNFVPLPETVVPAVESAEELPDHDRYDPSRHSGYFEVTLTTMAPVYVRGPLTKQQFDQVESGEDEKKEKFWERAANRRRFFYTADPNRPVIPGSTLRGMLRAVLEIASYSKVQWVTGKKLFFRTVGPDSLGKYYGSRMVEVQSRARNGLDVYLPKVEAGFLRRRPDGSWYIETCDIARVEMELLAQAFGLKGGSEKPDRYKLYELQGRAAHWGLRKQPNLTPRWAYQHSIVYVDVDSPDYHKHGKKRPRPFYLCYPKVKWIGSRPEDGKDCQKGTLVLTGNVANKHMAFVFLPADHPEQIDIPNDPDEPDINKRLWDLFHDDDQITQWQQQAFPTDKPDVGSRQRAGWLREDEPVFFLRENGELVFFGRAQMFRLPYRNRPLDLVPEELRDPCVIDYAEALFGYLRTKEELDRMGLTGGNRPPQGDKRRGYAGRVFVTDAVLEDGQKDVWLVQKGKETKRVRSEGGAVLLDPEKKALVPKILASPKPTAFQMYLTQEYPNDSRKLYHYDTNQRCQFAKTAIRGTKRYWHQGLNEAQDLKPDGIVEHIQESPQADVRADDTQHTVVKPVKPGVKFRFRVYFENLNDRELGALCWALHPLGEKGKQYYHHVGMGKPLGMGSVKLEATLHPTDRKARYERLFAEASSRVRWQEGALRPKNLWDREELAELVRPFEEHVIGELCGTGEVEHLFQIRRVAMLLKMMEWPGFRARWDDASRSENTRYMRIDWPKQPRDGSIEKDNEYRFRPVLPDPSAYGGLAGSWSRLRCGGKPAPKWHFRAPEGEGQEERSRQDSS